MNTQVGKSAGIALLLAAALLAALFAMGVFAPAGVDAAVKAQPGIMVKITDADGNMTKKPGAENVTVKVTFEINDDVDGANISGGTNDDVTVKFGVQNDSLFDSSPALNADKVRVEQDGKKVGKFVIRPDGDDSALIQITYPQNTGGFFSGTGNNGYGIVKKDKPVTVTISGMTLGLLGERNVEVGQGASTQTKAVMLSPSVIDAEVELESIDDAMGDHQSGANVTMTLTFTVDTAGASAAASETDVMIDLPSEYDLDTDGAGSDTGGTVSSVNGATKGAVTNSTINVHGFGENKEVTVTITGLRNPANSQALAIKFKYGEATVPDRIVPLYITKIDELAATGTLLPAYAKSPDSTMEFRFGSVVDLSTPPYDGATGKSEIVIEVDDGFSGLSAENVSVMQRQDRNGDPVDVGGNIKVDGNTITIMHDDASDAKNVMKTMGRNVGEVMVKITGLTNPSEDGNWQALTVKQDGFSPLMYLIDIAKAPEEPRVVLSSNKADAAVTLEIGSMVGGTREIKGGEDIVVTLAGFQIPGSIDENSVIIDGDGAEEFYGNPASVAVSGSKITLSLPTRIAATGAVIDPVKNYYKITFKLSAGIKNPNSAGTKTVTVQDDDPAVDGKHHEMKVAIVSHVSAKPVWVSRGDAIAVTGKGINSAGTVTLHLYEGEKDAADLMGSDLTGSMVLGSASMDGGTAVVEFDATSSSLMAKATKATDTLSAGATNTIVMVDAGGNVIGHTNVGIKPTVKLDVTDVRRSGKMSVSVSDWYYGDIHSIKVNGINVMLPDGPDTDDIAEDWKRQSVSGMKRDDIEVIVDRTVRLGDMEVAVYGTTYDMQGSLSSQDKHTQTVKVGVFDLSVDPGTAVTYQVIRIEGTGFLSRACITSIMVGEQAITKATTGDEIGSDDRDCVDTDSNGKLADSFRVPSGLKPGTYRLVVRDEGNRVGEADLTIPKPAITLTPSTGQRGDTVVVEGTNFPAEDLITVRYRGTPVASGTTDTIGKLRATFTVPIDAPIGATHEVLAKSENRGDGSTVDGVTRANLSATADHVVPDETLELSPETVAAGGRLTVTGGNLPLFTPVTVTIGGIPAAGRAVGEGDVSDGTGKYERVILVPQLTPGTHTVELTAHARNEDISVARFVTIAALVTRPTAEVFEGLIEAGQLVSVWRWNNDQPENRWDVYFPENPNPPVSDLEEVSTGDIVWVTVTENVEFQGKTLFAGTNTHTME
jgi:hypothetical protein